MRYPPDLTEVTHLTSYKAESEIEFGEWLIKAKEFVEGEQWCEAILDIFVAAFFPGILLLTLMKVRVFGMPDDEWMWVICGDLPSACLPDESCITRFDAVEVYIGEMDAWAKAAIQGQSTVDCIPVYVEPTREYGEMLMRRLDFLESRILPLLKQGTQSPEPSKNVSQ